MADRFDLEEKLKTSSLYTEQKKVYKMQLLYLNSGLPTFMGDARYLDTDAMAGTTGTISPQRAVGVDSPVDDCDNQPTVSSGSVSYSLSGTTPTQLHHESLHDETKER